MSTIDMNSVLLQMRAMAARAQGLEAPAALPGVENVNSGFGTMFKTALGEVNQVQQRANELSTAFATGASGADIAEVMLTMQKASLSFQAVTQVRNKLIAAYQEVMNMQI
jgi:flagellar hook-basal body complex protein FliE